MLVLSRKSQEAVVVGGSDRFEHLLKVTVLEIRGGKVRLGFEVDATVPVQRWEVWERIQASGGPSFGHSLSSPVSFEMAVRSGPCHCGQSLGDGRKAFSLVAAPVQAAPRNKGKHQAQRSRMRLLLRG